MLVVKVDFASPEFDELTQFRIKSLLEPHGIEWSEESIEREYYMTHYALYNEHGRLIGGAMFEVDKQEVELEPSKGDEEELVEAKETLPLKAKMHQFVLKGNFEDDGQFFIQELEKALIDAEIEEFHLKVDVDHISMLEEMGFKKYGRSFKELGKKHYRMSKPISMDDLMAVDNEELYEDL